jgi:hypothetical protein
VPLDDADVTPGHIDHNFMNNAMAQMVDPHNRDFRPRKDSEVVGRARIVLGITKNDWIRRKDIGAYNWDAKNYWIPGYQSAQASQPIPMDNAQIDTLERDLIWLGGYDADRYHIYLGTDKKAVSTANRYSKEFVVEQRKNICRIKELKMDRTYYWRVDSIGETIAKGPVWEFAVTRNPDLSISALKDFGISAHNRGGVLRNGEFAGSVAPWEPKKREGSWVEAHARDGYCEIHVRKIVKDKYWVAGLIQDFIALKQDREYTLRFSARTDSDQTPFGLTIYGDKEGIVFSADKSNNKMARIWRNYSYSFSPKSSSNYYKLSFSLGAKTGRYYLKDVSMKADADGMEQVLKP